MTDAARELREFERWNGHYMPAASEEAVHHLPEAVRAAVRELTDSRIVGVETHYGGWSAPDWEYAIRTLDDEHVYVDWGDDPWAPVACASFM